MAFGLGFEIGGLQFRADGGAGVFSDGFALRLSVHASADAPVFSIEADGTIQVNTTGHAVTLGNATVATGSCSTCRARSRSSRCSTSTRT